MSNCFPVAPKGPRTCTVPLHTLDPLSASDIFVVALTVLLPVEGRRLNANFCLLKETLCSSIHFCLLTVHYFPLDDSGENGQAQCMLNRLDRRLVAQIKMNCPAVHYLEMMLYSISRIMTSAYKYPHTHQCRGRSKL